MLIYRLYGLTELKSQNQGRFWSVRNSLTRWICKNECVVDDDFKFVAFDETEPKKKLLFEQLLYWLPEIKAEKVAFSLNELFEVLKKAHGTETIINNGQKG